MIVRELLTKVGFKLNRASVNRANQAMSGLKNAAIGLAAAFSAVQIGRGLANIADAAADAEEQMNALNVTLGKENAEAIAKWSDEIADKVGRSKYALQDMAAELSGVTDAMLGDSEQATDMSMKLVQRAIDIGSVRNKKAKDVLNDFRAALSGSVETMNKYGAVLTVANTEEFMRQKGIRGSWRTMSQAARTQIRYMMIMEKTQKMHGDAANTIDSYANAIKAVGAIWNDLKVEVGKNLIPALEPFIKQLKAVVKGWREWVKANQEMLKSKIAEYIKRIVSVIKNLISYTVFLFDEFNKLPSVVQNLIKIAGVIILIAGVLMSPWLILIAIGIAVIAIIDDFENWRKGNKSVIGELLIGLDKIWEKTNGVRQAFKDFFDYLTTENIGTIIWDALFGTLKIGFSIVKAQLIFIKDALEWIWDKSISIWKYIGNNAGGLVKMGAENALGVAKVVSGYEAAKLGLSVARAGYKDLSGGGATITTTTDAKQTNNYYVQDTSLYNMEKAVKDSYRQQQAVMSGVSP